MIEIKNLVITDGRKSIIKDISIQFNDGEVVGIIGRSGSGKSMLIRAISSMVGSLKGTIQIDGRKVDSRLRLKGGRVITPIYNALPQNMEERIEKVSHAGENPIQKTLQSVQRI